MSEAWFLAVDSGTQSTRAAVISEDGRLLSSARSETPISIPRPSYAEQDPEVWWSALCSAVRSAILRTGTNQLSSLCIAYQRESFVLCDRDLKPLHNGILWMDQRAAADLPTLREEIGADYFHETTGKPMDTTPSFVKLAWLRRHSRELFKRGIKFLDVGSFLHHRLTGNAVSPLAGADATGLLDIRVLNWSPALLECLEIETEALPLLVPSGQVIGRITEAASAATGLPVGLKVVAGGGDGQVFALCSDSEENPSISMNLGTAVTLGFHTNTPTIGPGFRTMVGVPAGTYLLEPVIRAGTQIISWFLREMSSEERRVARLLSIAPEELLEQEAMRIGAGSDGLMTLPFWRGRMMPTNQPAIRGAILGWSDHHSRAHMYRSILEGIAYEICTLTQGIFETKHGLVAGGGGGRSRLWSQIISDVTGRDVHLLADPEATLIGAAALAAVATGAHETPSSAIACMSVRAETLRPDPCNQRVYDRLYRSVYEPASRDMEGTLTALASATASTEPHPLA